MTTQLLEDAANLAAEARGIDPAGLTEDECQALLERKYVIWFPLYDTLEAGDKLPTDRNGQPLAARELDHAFKAILARRDLLKFMREGRERAEHNKAVAEAQDKAAFTRATTIRPKRPVPADIDALKAEAIPAEYKLAKYANGNRLLKSVGLLAIVQTFDTREWQWCNESLEPVVRATERFKRYAERMITQVDIDQETAYIYGPWAADMAAMRDAA